MAINAECRECGNPLPPGARFCNQCAAAVAPGAAPEGSAIRSRLPWVVAGAALVGLAAVLLLPRMKGTEEAQPAPFAAAATAPAAAGPAAAGPGAPAGNARAVDLSSMTPREAADRLFNRVMENVTRGDTAQARTFLPMAIAAYGRVEPLDSDGHYHLAVLHLVGGDPRSARAEADLILETRPTHLFGLFTAAQAEQAMGNSANAQALLQRFLASYPTERGQALPEYSDHASALPPMKTEAERLLAAVR